MAKAINQRLQRRDEKLNVQLIPIYDPTRRLFLASEDPSPINPEQQWETMRINMEFGIITINEARDAQGLPGLAAGAMERQAVATEQPGAAGIRRRRKRLPSPRHPAQMGRVSPIYAQNINEAPMADSAATLSAELLSLWPKLQPAYRLVREWDRRDGIIFVSADDQSLLAARQVAEALGGKTVELTDNPIRKADYDAQAGKFLDKNLLESPTLFDESIDRLCVLIPRIDTQPDWLYFKIKSACERAPRPFVLLLTCPNLEWMPDFLHGHLFECRKKGAARQSPESE